jgi:GNAT superfamily N-acetyltransferase
MDTNLIEELKEATDPDAKSIRSLVAQLDDQFQVLSDEDIKEMLSASSNHLYVYREKESHEIVGMITLIVYRIPYKMKGWLEDVVVDEKHRGKGIATLLMEHAIEEAKNHHVKSLDLTSNPKRESANQLYVRLGFEKRDTNVYRLTL